MRKKEPQTRAAQKEHRRSALLNAAEVLIRASGSTDFSMAALATRAGFSSQTTPYNLFGTKAGVLYALLNRSADRIFELHHGHAKRANAWQDVLAASDALAEAIVGDPDFYRPLYAFLFGVVDPLYRPAFIERTTRFWSEALAGLAREGVFVKGLTMHNLVGQFVIQAIGTVERWVQRELEGPQLGAQLRHGSCLLLLAVAPEKPRRWLIAELSLAGRQLSAPAR
jgi:AcrR family transcriptional regulator